MALREPQGSQARIAKTAFFVGLVSLIPIPYVDGVIDRELMRRLYGELASARGVTLSEAQCKALTRRESHFIWGMVVAGFVWLFKKLVRTITVVLLLKEVVDTATLAIHRARLVEVAIQNGHVPGGEDRVLQAMNVLMLQHESRVFNRWVRRLDVPPTDLRQEPGVPAAVMRWLHFRGGGAKLEMRFLQKLEELKDSED